MRKLHRRLISLTIAFTMLVPGWVTAVRAETDAAVAISQMETMASTLNSLIDTCEADGIPCDYELAALSTINIFIDFIEEDVANSDTGRVDYTLSAITDIYNEAKANLDAYIAGTKIPMQVPKYETSDVTIDGHSLIATAKWSDGTVERRPMFFVGYGHFNAAGDLFPMHYEMGMNSSQLESGPNRLVKDDFGWTWNKMNNFEGDFEIKDNAGIDGTRALYLTCDYTANIPNVYMVMNQYITVTEGKTYVISAKTKGTSGYAGLAVNQFAPTWASKNFTSSADWTDYTLEFTPKEGSGTSNAKITLYVNFNTDLYVDNLTICEKGTSNNLLVNSGFEASNEAKDLRFDENEERVVSLKNYLQSAEDNNTTVDLLLSPHNFPTDVITEYDLAMDNGFMAYNPFKPVAQEIVEKYVRGIVEVAKRYDSVKSICLTNEPVFYAINDEEFFLADWQTHIQGIYGNIEALNEAYGTSYTSFDEVDMQGYSAIPAKNYDYKLFNDNLGSEWHKWIYDIVKDVWPEVPVGTKLSGYLSSNRNTGDKNKGVNFGDLAEYLEINGYDLSNYYGWDFPAESGFWQDYMISIKDVPGANYEDHIIADYDTDVGTTYSNNKDEHTYTNLFQGAIHGRVISDIWSWSRSNEEGNWARLLHPYRPDVVYKTSKANLDLNRLAEEVVLLSNAPKTVGIVMTDASLLQDLTSVHAAYEAYEATIYSGGKVKFITDNNFADIEDLDFVIVPNQKYISNQMLSAISDYVNLEKSLLIMGSDSLSMTERGTASNAALLSNITDKADVITYVAGYDNNQIHNKDVMTTPTKASLRSTIQSELSALGLNRVTVKDSQGAFVSDVEINVAECENGWLVNLANYSGASKSVSVYVDNVKVTSSVDLISGEGKGETITLSKLTPVLLKITNTYSFANESTKPEKWSVDWGYYAKPESGDVAIMTGQAKQSGNYSLYLNQVDDSTNAEEVTISTTDNVTLTPGNYNLTFWAMADSIDGLTFKMNGGKIIAQFVNGVPAYFGGGYTAEGSVESTRGLWTKYKVSFTVDTAVTGKFQIYANCNLSNVLLDDLVLVNGTSGANLLADGGFEDVTVLPLKTGEYSFNSWSHIFVNISADLREKAFVEPVADVSYADANSAHVVWPFGENFDNRYIRFQIGRSGGFPQGKYRVSLAIKNVGTDLGISPGFDFVGSMNLQTATKEDLGNGWVKYTGDVTTSGNASGFRINVTSGYTNLYIDNVEVYPYISDTEVGETNYISDPGFTNVTVNTTAE